MDYEKKYKEALERFKTFREKYCTYGELHFGDVIFDKTGEAQKDLDAIFPELADSEDERIRKALIDEIKVWDEDYKLFKHFSKEKVIAYLEKQKEPIDPFDTKLFQDGVKEGRRLEREDMEKEQKPLSTEETKLNSIAFLEQMGYTCIPPGAKQAEWSEDKFPKDIEKDATQFCFDKGFNITPYQAKEIAAHYLMIGHNFGYVEGRKNAHIPAKELGLPSSMDFKQEWSEEDETMLRTIISDGSRGVELDSKQISWLKSRRQAKDCSSCAKHLEGYISGRSDAENKLLEQFGALITPEDELHIKPRWKPSEEHFQGLRRAITKAEKGSDAWNSLTDLYEQLKKL